MKQRKIILTLLSLFGALSLMAQQKTITGTVKDVGKNPLPGVFVMVKGTTIGITTDSNGNFSLNVPDTVTSLLAKFVGMNDTETAIKGDQVDFVMEEFKTELEEVVVVGYSSMKRRDLTGSVSSISDKALKDIPVASATEAITGRMAGVNVSASEGSPDAEIRIRVRGGTSISQDNSPLYVVDGIIVNTISDIPPSDISSIDVLKDAASTAIYGARGANGVILITTKGGREGKISINFNSFLGFKKSNSFIDVLSPYEYAYYQYEIAAKSNEDIDVFQSRYGRFQDLDIYKSDSGIDWQKKVFGNTGLQQYYNLGVSGGGKNSIYSVNLTHNDEDYIMINSNYVRDNVNFKVNSNINSKLNLSFNIRISNETINGPSVSAGSGVNTRLRNAVKYSPTRGLSGFDSSVDEDLQDLGMISNLNNPVDDISNEYKKVNKFTNFNIFGLNWTIAKNLKFVSNISYAFKKNKTDNVWADKTGVSKKYGGLPVAMITSEDGRSYQISNTLSYNFKPSKDHNFDFLIGQEISEKTSDLTILESRYYPQSFTAKEVLASFNNGIPQPTVTRIGEPQRMSSFFARANYSYKGKYLLSLVTRKDGISVFGPGLYWGFFPGSALAWRMSDEDFMKSISVVDNLKLRLSYGSVGNAQVSPYWRDIFNSSSGTNYFPGEQVVSVLTPNNTLRSNGLTWETTYSTNLGLDFGLLKNRISGTIDLYNNVTKNLIVRTPIPATTGYTGQYQNIGQTTNKGLEIGLTGYIIEKKDFTLSANFNIAFNKNRVDKFSNGNVDYKLYGSGWNGSAEPVYDYIVRQGDPLGQMYGYVTDGMYSFDDFTWDSGKNTWSINEGVADNSAITSVGNYFGPGTLKFKKLADDGTNKITEKDLTVIGNALPKHTGGFGFNGNYKGFDFSMFFNWSYGNKIYNANKLDFTSYLDTRKYQNLSSTMELSNRFTTIDPATGNNIYTGTNADPELLRTLNEGKTMWHPLMTRTALHSWAIEDGSFLRLNNLTLGYTLPKHLSKKLAMETLRIYMSGYNLYCWTKYSGPDPEVSTRTGTAFTPGVDYSAYPKSKTIVGGINITF